ncbi:NINE protein [Psychrobacter fozii]|uniref:TM2 domain-containing membrane protein YozV n=1 Tax=Psychrobacter fozii TaxID=198480 RepID=A0A2V4UFT6_9GAMM|nr:NINE protein [Psychrobacter fozii]PYE38997.1 TM2 domain-containing membrane protein YozV [Psychrobacter fozii]
MAIIDCPECTHKISDQSLSCTNCGCPTSKMKFLIRCPECSKSISNQSISCTNCGFPIAKPAPFKAVPPPLPTQNPIPIVQGNRKSKGTAALLAFLLGGLGIHKFYLDQVFWGILYLLFCWTFIPVIISMFEVIILLFMDESEFNKRFS